MRNDQQNRWAESCYLVLNNVSTVTQADHLHPLCVALWTFCWLILENVIFWDTGFLKTELSSLTVIVKTVYFNRDNPTTLTNAFIIVTMVMKGWYSCHHDAPVVAPQTYTPIWACGFGHLMNVSTRLWALVWYTQTLHVWLRFGLWLLELGAFFTAYRQKMRIKTKTRCWKMAKCIITTEAGVFLHCGSENTKR